jgi:hypothetical protein
MSKYTLVVWTNPSEGREAEYNDWYNNIHLAEVVSIPGFVAAQRYKLNKPLMGEPYRPYLALYEMDVDNLEAAGKAFELLGTTPMNMSDALDTDRAMANVFETCSPRVGTGQPGDFIMMALTNPVAGREAEFNEWYNTVHLKEITAIPGFAAAERATNTPAGVGAPDHAYQAVYEMAATSQDAADAALGALFGAQLTQTDTQHNEAVVLCVLQKCSPRVASKSKAVA